MKKVLSLAILLSLLMIISIPALAIQITDEKGITFIDYDEGAEWNNLISGNSDASNSGVPFEVQEIIGVTTHVIGIPGTNLSYPSSRGSNQYRFSVGAEMHSFAPGIGATYNINDQIAVQGIIGIPTDLVDFSGVKLLYRFAEGEKRNYYLFGLGGIYSEKYYPDDVNALTGAGYAGGIGLEYSPNSFPDSLRYSFEIGQAGTSIPDYPNFLYVNLGFRVYF